MMRTYAASLAIVALIIVPAATLKAFSLRVFSSGGGGSWKDGTYAVTVGSTVRFTCTPSGGASPYAYVWDFDDIETYKKPTTGQNPSHTFGLPGIHDVRVYVADNESNEESAYLRIHVLMMI
jgi:PKD repeat protein